MLWLTHFTTVQILLMFQWLKGLSCSGNRDVGIRTGEPQKCYILPSLWFLFAFMSYWISSDITTCLYRVTLQNILSISYPYY